MEARRLHLIQKTVSCIDCPSAPRRPLDHWSSWKNFLQGPEVALHRFVLPTPPIDRGTIQNMAPPTIDTKRCSNGLPRHYTPSPTYKYVHAPSQSGCLSDRSILERIISYGSQENPLLPIFDSRCTGELPVVLQATLPDTYYDSHVNDG